jgi:hypothetical protein
MSKSKIGGDIYKKKEKEKGKKAAKPNGLQFIRLTFVRHVDEFHWTSPKSAFQKPEL